MTENKSSMKKVVPLVLLTAVLGFVAVALRMCDATQRGLVNRDGAAHLKRLKEQKDAELSTNSGDTATTAKAPAETKAMDLRKARVEITKHYPNSVLWLAFEPGLTLRFGITAATTLPFMTDLRSKLRRECAADPHCALRLDIPPDLQKRLVTCNSQAPVQAPFKDLVFEGNEKGPVLVCTPRTACEANQGDRHLALVLAPAMTDLVLAEMLETVWTRDACGKVTGLTGAAQGYAIYR